MQNLRAVGAYIFAGGFTLGVRQHFKVHCHLEETAAYGMTTSRQNMPDIPVFTGVETWGDAEHEELDARYGVTGIDWIYGNPPCAAWSMAGRRGDSWHTDSRVDCTRTHFNLLKRYRPRAWTWESVSNAFSRGREFVDGLAREALDLGYDVTFLLHDGQHLGLPQERKRFFFVATDFEFLPDHSTLTPARSAAEVLRGLNDPGEPLATSDAKRLQYLFKHCPPGAQLYRVFDELGLGDEVNHRGQVKGRPGFLVRRLPASGPALTFAGGLAVHPTEDRALTVKECGVLCGYPPDYEFVAKGDSAKLSLIARGVCPPVGEWLAVQLADHLRRGSAAATGRVRLADFRSLPGSVTDITHLYQPQGSL
jgi:DNA (cytosine-5)-methyltransferase 1